MAGKRLNPTLGEEALGAAAIAGTILASPVLRPWYSRWDAKRTEVTGSLPGDELVPKPVLVSTRAVTIQAPIESVWPWLVQMGQGRGGFYSYQRLENLVGCDMHNADQIMPEYQRLAVGDKIRLAPEGRGPFFLVSSVEPGRAIVLRGDDPPTAWSFVLEPRDARSTRLLIRYQHAFERNLGNVLSWRALVDPIAFWMERKMLQGIKARAENAVLPARGS